MFRSKRFQQRVTAGRFTLPTAILLAALMWLVGGLLLPVPPEAPREYRLWEMLMPDGMSSAWGFRLLNFLLCVAIGYLLIGLNNRFALIRMRASVQTSVYLLLAAGCPCIHQFHAGDVASIMFLPTLFFLFHSYQSQRPETDLFHAFFFLSTGSLVFPQLILLVPVCWIGAYQFRSLQPRSFCATLIGWSLPYLLLASYAFYTESPDIFFLPFEELATLRISGFSMDPWQIATTAYLLLLFAVSAIHCMVTGFDDKIRTRSYLNFVALTTLFLFLLLFVQPGLCPQLLSLLLPGIGILSGHLFMLSDSRPSNLFFIASLIGLAALYGFNLYTSRP